MVLGLNIILCCRNSIVCQSAITEVKVLKLDALMLLFSAGVLIEYTGDETGFVLFLFERECMDVWIKRS